ncbi:hypothetical protein AB4516_20785, partial [Vibrio sp. 10N.222.54.F12]
ADAGDVNEGSTANFAVSLDKPSEAAVTLTLDALVDGQYSAEANDVGAISASYTDAQGTVHTLAVSNGEVTVPAGVTAIIVSVAT